MKKLFILFSIAVVLTIALVPEVAAQCPMCKMSAESNLRDGGTAGKGLNNGILYMFIMPYILVGFLAYLWHRNKKNYDNESLD